MPRGVQITIVTSLRGSRCVESLKGITLYIFIENERIRLYICIIVSFLKSFIRFSVAYES